MSNDWLSSTPDARRQLYRCCKRIVDREYGGRWSPFYGEVFGAAVTFGSGYEDNFRAGRISRVKANMIAQWLARSHPAEAGVLDAAIGTGSERLQTDYHLSRLFAASRATGMLAIVAVEQTDLTIVGIAQRRNDQTYRLRLGQMFCLDFTIAHAGTALAFQLYKSRWYPLPLTDRSLTAPVETGTHIFPRSMADGSPLPLSEEAQAGRFQFAVLITEAPIAERLAAILEEGLEIAPAIQATIVEAVTTADLPVQIFTADAQIS